MSEKKQTKKPAQRKPQKGGMMCNFAGPGPYPLKPLVGYNDHCFSKYRNPAYSIIGKAPRGHIADGPGPKYKPEFPPAKGFSVGLRLKDRKLQCSPGPYDIPPFTPTPAFSMKGRTKERGRVISAGPYNIPRDLNGPAFTIGVRLPSGLRPCGPGPTQVKLDLVKPRAPAYSLRWRPRQPPKCGSPGPYDPPLLDKAPAFTFGVKHHPCAPPLITECDRVC